MRKSPFRWTPGLCLTALLGLMLAVAACDSAPSPTAPPPPDTPASGGDNFVAGGPAGPGEADHPAPGFGAEVPIEAAVRGEACEAPKVRICHLPPGNPGNFQDICIAESAVAAHEAHGDHPPFTFWPDADGDGYGDSGASSETGCIVPDGFVENNDDCDDTDAAINPDAEEVCDDLDNNCDGDVDEGDVCGPVCVDLGCPCFSCAELAANGAILECGENFPGFPNLTGMIWTSGFVACSGESCATGGLPTTCAITSPPSRFQVVSADEDAACRAMILASCPNPNFSSTSAVEPTGAFIDQ